MGDADFSDEKLLSGVVPVRVKRKKGGVEMAVYVMIKRKFKMNSPEKLVPLLEQLKSRAKEQPGYLTTEILQSSENPEDYLVISQWQTAESWKEWFTSKERRDLQGQVDSLIGERTFYEIFEPVG